MLFNSIEFVIFFVFVLSVIFVIRTRRFQHVFLLFASYFFFYYSSNYLIVLLIFTTIWDFYFGEMIYRAKTIKLKKIILIVSLAGNLGLLGFFKYANFAILQFNILGNYLDFKEQIPSLDIALPIAISFYTFHSITYTVSIFRNQITPVKSFVDYALFVAFFPQLVAGPILRAKEFLPQLREKIDNFRTGYSLILIQNTNLKQGITLMALGFLKKMFFADNIAPMINEIFSNPIGLESYKIILGTIGFGIQIYCDFSGYSDIAIGAALILGLKIPINFNKPYFATSPADFWRRWHISLSTWLRDYLYIPIGGNRISRVRTYVNLMVVMLIGGLWHGASWNFVIWGCLHGIYLSIHRLFLDIFPSLKEMNFFKGRHGKVISILVTQYFVFLAWIPFRVGDLDAGVYSITKYIMFDFKISDITQFLVGHKLPVILIFLFLSLHFILYIKPELYSKISNLNIKYWTVFLTSISLLVVLFFDGDPLDFIYFRF